MTQFNFFYTTVMNFLHVICVWLFTNFILLLKRKFIHVPLKKIKEHTINNNAVLVVPKSVNYHFTRQCNYQCGFCFHTAKTSFVLPLVEAKRGLKLLKEAGMEKLNFSGGEPFIKDGGHYMGDLIRYCKEELSLPSVSIVSNGSLIKKSWFKQYGKYLDIIAISCDSFDEETNRNIGRGQGNKNHIEKLRLLHSWCQQYKVAFKINTVVNTYNINEDMAENICYLNPIRWKVFQCLLLEGENVGANALRNAEKYYISDKDFQRFLDRHSHVKALVAESNTKDYSIRYIGWEHTVRTYAEQLPNTGRIYALFGLP